MGKKTTAADRTISFLDGKTQEEKDAEAERIRLNADIQEEHRTGSPTIEDNADRYRANAFSGQEFLSKHFGDASATENQYRISTRNGMCYLEQARYTAGALGAYGYAGIMCPEKDLPAIARVAVDAAKAYLARTRGNNGLQEPVGDGRSE